MEVELVLVCKQQAAAEAVGYGKGGRSAVQARAGEQLYGRRHDVETARPYGGLGGEVWLLLVGGNERRKELHVHRLR